MIFPAGNGNSNGFSWLDNLVSKEGSAPIGKDAIDTRTLKKLAQIVEEDVKIEDAAPADVETLPVPTENEVSVSTDIVDGMIEEKGEV
ncbi:MAG: hypothetical protein NTW30_04915, partial [Candidatus Aenigmarchaeota archaeon]|nr:hypothetical protein [Candidatus Aenigmarchaeota archaeon]